MRYWEVIVHSSNIDKRQNHPPFPIPPLPVPLLPCSLDHPSTHPPQCPVRYPAARSLAAWNQSGHW